MHGLVILHLFWSRDQFKEIFKMKIFLRAKKRDFKSVFSTDYGVSFFLIKLHDFRPATLLKKDSNTGDFL